LGLSLISIADQLFVALHLQTRKHKKYRLDHLFKENLAE
jgi:hypothetical protein